MAAGGGPGRATALPPPASASASFLLPDTTWSPALGPVAASLTPRPGLAAKRAEVCRLQLASVPGRGAAVRRRAHSGVRESSSVNFTSSFPSESLFPEIFPSPRWYLKPVPQPWDFGSAPRREAAWGPPGLALVAQAHLLRVMFPGERRVVALFDLLAEGEEVHLISIEGALESCHLQGAGRETGVFSLAVQGQKGPLNSRLGCGPSLVLGTVTDQQALPQTPRKLGFNRSGFNTIFVT